MHLPSQLPVALDARFRPGAPASPERLAELASAIADGSYRVRPELVAEVLLFKAEGDRSARPD